MATRFRLTSSTTVPEVSPSLQSYTHNAPATVRRILVDKGNGAHTAALTTTSYQPDAADHLVAGDALHGQMVSGPMASGIAFNNAQTIKMAMQMLEDHANNNLFLQLFVSIVSEDGTSVRRTLRSKVADGTEVATSITNRFHSTTQDGANYTTVDGDRLVVELSFTGTPSATGGVQGHNGSMRWGSNGAGGDLAEDDSSTGSTLNGWIEFVPNIVWLIRGATISAGTALSVPTVINTQLVTNGTISSGSVLSAPSIKYQITPNPIGLNLIASNDISNSIDILYVTADGLADSFTGSGRYVTGCRFYLGKNVGSPTGTYAARIYASTGTPGTNSTPTGAALAESNALNIQDLTQIPTFASVTLTFSTPFLTTNGTAYHIAIVRLTGTADSIAGRTGEAAGQYSGNGSSLSSGTWTPGLYDFLFDVITNQTTLFAPSVAYAITTSTIGGISTVTRVSDGNGYNGSPTGTIDFAALLNTTGADALLVGTVTDTQTSNTTATWDQGGANQSLPELGSPYDVPGGIGRIRFFGVVTPSQANGTLRLAHSGGANEYFVFAIAVSGADQTGGTTTFVLATNNSGTGVTATITINSATGRMTVDLTTGPQVLSAPTQTQIFVNNSGGVTSAGASRAAGSASNTHQWTFASSINWGSRGLSILNTSGGTSALYVPTVTQGGAGDQSVTGGTIASGSALTAPTVAYAVTNGTIASGSTLSAPTVTQITTGATIASGSALSAPTLAYAVTNSSIASTLVLSTPTLAYVITTARIGSALRDDMVSVWEFHEPGPGTVLGQDSHGSNHLTDHNGATVDSGIIDSDGVSFDAGSSQYLSINSNPTLQSGDIGFTIQAWIKLKTDGTQYIVSKWTGLSAAYEYAIGYLTAPSNTFFFDVKNIVEDIKSVHANYEVVTGTWYHVVGWHDPVNNQIGIVVNATSGAEVFDTVNNGITPTNTEFRIGGRADDTDFADAWVDEVIIWKRVLTEAERIELYNQNAGLNYAAMSVGYNIFAPTVSIGQSVTGVTIASGNTLSSPTITVGAVTVVNGTIAAGSTLSAPTVVQVTTGAFITSTLLLSAPSIAYEITTVTVSSTMSLFAATVTVGDVTVETGTIASTLTIAAPNLAHVITQATIASTLTLSQPDVAYALTTGTIASTSTATAPSVAYEITNGTIASSAVLNAPSITVGDVSITGGTIASTLLVNEPLVSAGGTALVAGTVSSTVTLFAVTVSPGAVEITGAFIASAIALNPPTVIPDQVATGATIASTVSLSPPSVSVGGIAITGGTIASTLTVTEPSVTVGDVTVTGGTVASTLTLMAPTVIADQVATGATVTSTLSLTPPTVTPGAVEVTGGTIASTLTVTEPSVAFGDLVVTLPLLASTVTLTEPSVTVGDVGVEIGTIVTGSVVFPPRVSFRIPPTRLVARSESLRSHSSTSSLRTVRVTETLASIRIVES